MVELAEGEPGRPGFFCLHLEVADVDEIVPRTGWLELTERGREHRPPGRDLLNIRWRGWAHYAGIFATSEPYWRSQLGPRFIAVGRVPRLDDALNDLQGRGWTIAHSWAFPTAKGAYVAPPGQPPVEVTIAGGAERIEVEGITMPEGNP